MERGTVTEPDNSVSGVDQHQGELSRGLPQPEQPRAVGVPVITRNIFVHPRQVQLETHAGRVCQQPDQAVGSVHVSVPGHRSSGQGCSDQQVGPSLLGVSTGPTHHEVFAEDPGRGAGGDNDRSAMADIDMVVNVGDIDGGAIPEVAALQVSSDNGESRSGPSLPGPIDSSSFEGLEGQERVLSSGSDGIDQSLQMFLSRHLSSGTSKTYKCSFEKFTKFCTNLGVSAASCGPDIIVQFIKKLFDDGVSYNTVNHARSAISKYHQGFNGVSAGSHKLVCQAVKSVFKQRPPIPRYETTFDINVVFNYIKSLPPNHELSLKLLTFKALFLLTCSSISRMSSVKQLGPNVTVYKVINYFEVNSTFYHPYYLQDHVTIPLIGLEKQSRPGHVRGHLRIQRFDEDPSLCPVSVLTEYFEKVSSG